MELPKKFRTYGQTWTIMADEQYLRENQAWGDTRFSTLTIALDTSLSQGQLQQTLFDELLHIADAMGLPVEDGEGQSSERTIHRLANALFAILIDNPELVGYCFGPTLKRSANHGDTKEAFGATQARIESRTEEGGPEDKAPGR